MTYGGELYILAHQVNIKVRVQTGTINSMASVNLRGYRLMVVRKISPVI